ncbi:MAG: Lpg1974 family pore-forming outer membrane protein [Legionellaceae bacterium]|nr:Lpg1974 family pore-forming outer membrane protein [Legionellaceae bacterium]
MLNLKKTAVAVLALSSSAVFAGSMGPVCSAVNVTVPCESTAWDIGAKALYLQPAFSDGYYSYPVVNSATGAYQNFNQTWAWGFFIEGSYHFNTGNDANLNWYHINKTSSRNITSDLSFIPDLSVTGASSISLAPKWDAVNLEFGQHVDLGENKNIRFHGGFQYARIANTEKRLRSATIQDQEVVFAVQTKPTYNGFGARVGADMGYEWGNGLGVYANGAAALLAGTSKISRSVVINGATVNTPNASKATIVPELEAKLGVKYGYAMAQGDLTLDVGWMWINYFNPTQAIASTPTNRRPQVVSGDFGLQGLYFGLNWLGNVA